MTSNARLPEPLELPLAQSTEVATLASEAGQWAVTRGLVKDVPGTGVTHAPLALYPSPFPKAAFEHVWALQPLMNRLLSASASDSELLHKVLRPVAKRDPFVASQLAILEAVGGVPGGRSGVVAGIWRTDYLLHQPQQDNPLRILQVEQNAISVAYAALSSIACSLHEYQLKRGAVQPALEFDSPPNAALKELVALLTLAHSEYVARQAPAATPVVVMVVQAGELNQYDQRWIQYLLFESAGINMVRATHDSLMADLEHDDEAGTVQLNGAPVSVFYFRAGYTPDDYPSQAHWDIRATIEASTSVKIPDIAHQLAGTKAMQRALADPEVLTRYVSPSEAAAASSVFAGLYDLPADSGRATEVLAQAAAAPDDYVLKPQREGGGNNLYRAALAKAIATKSRDELEAYILMERIVPPLARNLVLRGGVVKEIQGVSELGIFGLFFKDVASGTEIDNKAGGYLLRTKPADVDEGGVSAGVAYLDSVALVDLPFDSSPTMTIPGAVRKASDAIEPDADTDTRPAKRAKA
ncbi:glutathione synthetase [Thecamonas trahens ATCC 50062]|uniref:Glutathione synthetase n=1 Tax=Thecamonas trahens ATCC 50062 TaxID=461836 RepID=A0A0L0D2V5_THETB|nr:glutathione synthetase [Thecamonas trahens ATCC 50062]KNC46629.1 glutathione synthetase [Thecamonas trahens ATCC 50062]|eukprot:XP_013760402.1 glutathione synthetase [Thecamonas trahens ATCC 50062]